MSDGSNFGGKFRGNFNRGRDRGGRRYQGRGQGRSRGGGRGRGGGGNGYFHKDNLPTHQPESVTEREVGITEYISNLSGFNAAIKSRYSDFHVNEIDLDGNVLKLTDTNIPSEFKVEKVAVPVESPLKQIAEEQWKEITILLETGDDSQFIKIDVTSCDKDARSSVHKTLKSIFNTKIISNTVDEDGKKFILIKRMIGKNKHDRNKEWPDKLPIYTHFLLYKENIDTMNAIMSLGDVLGMNSTAFNYAGVKDRRAKTTQLISCKKLEPSKLFYRTKRLRNIKIGNITFKDEPLRLGQLSGNRFRLALRDVTIDDEIVDSHMNHLKEHGFINYYGLQRFGNDKSIPTHLIGLNLMKGEFKEACRLILKPKSYDNPASEITKAKKEYAETENATRAAVFLTSTASNQSLEAKLIHGLAKSGKNDFVNALECIPRNMRLMYIHAFQSLIWNQAVSERVKKFGYKPVVGDLVLLTKEEEGELLLDDVKGVVDTETEKESEDVTKDEEEINQDENGDGKEEELEQFVYKYGRKQYVKVLSGDDLSNYTIYDIVLPLPGYDVTYPENLKVFYTEILGNYNMQLEMSKQRVKTYTLSGNYRKIVRKAEDLTWKSIKYNNSHDTLILSDFEEILKHSEPPNEGIFKALIVCFNLKPSSYATMVLREILKIDTSTKTQSQRNTPVALEKEEECSSEPRLIRDKVRYAEFKRLLEGGAGEDALVECLNKPAEEESAPSKKTKLE